MDNVVVFSRRQTERFTRDGWARTYLIAPLTRLERVTADAAVVAVGGIYPGRPQMIAAMRAALQEAEVDGLAGHLETLDRALLSDGQDPETEAALARIETACLQTAPYRSLLAQRFAHTNAVPLIYAAHALRGWEGPDLPPFERRGGVVPEDLLESIPEEEIEAVGLRAYVLARPDKAAEGNSAAPSRSSGTPTGSANRKARRAAASGSSRAKRSRATPG